MATNDFYKRWASPRPLVKGIALNLAIERTKANKAELMRVLDFPALPLHNNAAELAARRVVRKRDICLHTCSDWGTQLRDAFMSIIETAIKLGISAFDFIHDRNCAGRFLNSRSSSSVG